MVSWQCETTISQAGKLNARYVRRCQSCLLPDCASACVSAAGLAAPRPHTTHETEPDAASTRVLSPSSRGRQRRGNGHGAAPPASESNANDELTCLPARQMPPGGGQGGCARRGANNIMAMAASKRSKA